jgi:hypothetical protein
MRNTDGSLRTRSQVTSSLHDAGWGAGNARIGTQWLAAGGAPLRPGATDAQIDAHLHNDDGSLRTLRVAAESLRRTGLGADNKRIEARRQAAGGTRHLPGATDEQINAHLHNDDGSLRSHRKVAGALHAAGLGASFSRIEAQRRAAREPQ